MPRKTTLLKTELTDLIVGNPPYGITTLKDTRIQGLMVRYRYGKGTYWYYHYAPNKYRHFRLHSRHPLGSVSAYAEVGGVDRARKDAAEMQLALTQGKRPNNKPRITLREHYEKNVKERWDHIQADTRAAYRQMWRDYILPTLGHRPVADIEWEELELWMHRHQNKPSRANQAKKQLITAFKIAERLNIIPRDSSPTRYVKWYPRPPRKRFLSPTELRAVFAAMDDPSLNTDAVKAIQLMILTGCRVREITELKWDQVDLPGGYLVFENHKTGAKRGLERVPLNEWAAKILRSCPFPGNPQAKVLARQGYWKTYRTWVEVVAKAGIKHTRLADLRKTFATYGLDAGASAADIAAALKHESEMTTRTYYLSPLCISMAGADAAENGILAALQRTTLNLPEGPAKIH